jgi:hypothetical protein
VELTDFTLVRVRDGAAIDLPGRRRLAFVPARPQDRPDGSRHSRRRGVSTPLLHHAPRGDERARRSFEGLLGVIESATAPALTHAIQGLEPITSDERVTLSYFAAAQLVRTPAALARALEISRVLHVAEMARLITDEATFSEAYEAVRSEDDSTDPAWRRLDARRAARRSHPHHERARTGSRHHDRSSRRVRGDVLPNAVDAARRAPTGLRHERLRSWGDRSLSRFPPAGQRARIAFSPAPAARLVHQLLQIGPLGPWTAPRDCDIAADATGKPASSKVSLFGG